MCCYFVLKNSKIYKKLIFGENIDPGGLCWVFTSRPKFLYFWFSIILSWHLKFRVAWFFYFGYPWHPWKTKSQQKVVQETSTDSWHRLNVHTNKLCSKSFHMKIKGCYRCHYYITETHGVSKTTNNLVGKSKIRNYHLLK